MPTAPHGPALLRGARWSLARPRSRALWTATTPTELAALATDPVLRRRAEDFLRLVAGSVDGVETLLFFDQDCDQLALALSLRPDPRAACVWDWSNRALAAPPAPPRVAAAR
jgi:hypothetical protein